MLTAPQSQSQVRNLRRPTLQSELRASSRSHHAPFATSPIPSTFYKRCSSIFKHYVTTEEGRSFLKRPFLVRPTLLAALPDFTFLLPSYNHPVHPLTLAIVSRCSFVLWPVSSSSIQTSTPLPKTSYDGNKPLEVQTTKSISHRPVSHQPRLRLLPVLLQPLRVLFEPLVLLLIDLTIVPREPGSFETDPLATLAVLLRSIEEECGY